MLKKVRLLCCFLLLAAKGWPQAEREDKVGSWVVTSLKARIADKWSIPVIGILRHYGTFDPYEFSFVRSGITYALNNTMNLTLGMAYLDSHGFDHDITGSATSQVWLYEEITKKTPLQKLNLDHRLRWETRWIRSSGNVNTNQRLRYRVQFKFPIHEAIYLRVFNEAFYNLNPVDFNQNRLFGGVGYTFSPRFDLSIGYLKNHFKNAHYDRLRIAMALKFDVRK